MAVTGRLGMNKAAKRAERLRGMQTNRKRDKAAWRSNYHREFKRNSGYATGGAPPMDWKRCGFTG